MLHLLIGLSGDLVKGVVRYREMGSGGREESFDFGNDRGVKQHDEDMVGA